MGKGYRNRDGRATDDSILTKPKKSTKQKKSRAPLPKWVVPVIVSVVAAVVVFAIVFAALAKGGTFKRNNILVKSQKTSKYNINEITAQILLWDIAWAQGEYYYDSIYSSSSSTDENQKFVYSWSNAEVTRSSLNYSIQQSAQWLTQLTALCDWGKEKNIEFTAQDEEKAYSSLLSEFRAQAKSYYKYAYEVGFPDGEDGTVKFPVNYSSSVDYDNLPYFYEFITEIFGNGVKEADFRRAATIMYYASRVSTIKEAEYWDAEKSEIEKELKENPESYYSLDYLKYAADDDAFATQLPAETDADTFKKLIVSDYVKKNYALEYNKGKAEAAQGKIADKEGEDLTTALEENGMHEAKEYTKPEEEGLAATGLTKEQTEWLFSNARAKGDTGVITEADEFQSLLVITEITKDDEENVTAVTAYVKTFNEGLPDEDVDKLISEVCYRLALPDTEHVEMEGMADLLDAMEMGADSNLPTESTIYYVKATELDKDLENVKSELDSAEDKNTYLTSLTSKGATQSIGIKADSPDLDANIKAVLFPEEGTVAVGLTQTVTKTDGTKHLIYVSDLQTGEGDEAQTLVSFWDYPASQYSTELQKWLFENMDEETMTGAPEVGKTFVEEDGKTSYIVTREFGLGKDVIRGGFAAFTDKETAEKAKAQLNGLTGINLLLKLKEVATTAIVSTDGYQLGEVGVKENSEALRDWLFDDSRAKNDCAVVDATSSGVSSYYLAVYLDRTSQGESAARDNYASQTESDWAKALAEDGGYKISESALKKIKNEKEPDTGSNEAAE